MTNEYGPPNQKPLWYCPIGHISHSAPVDNKCKICDQLDIIKQCVELVLTKTGVKVFRCNPSEEEKNSTNLKAQIPSGDGWVSTIGPIPYIDAPGLIEDAIAVTLENPPLPASGELSDDFTSGVRFACQVIRDNYSEPEILRIQMKIIQFELKYRFAIKQFKKHLQELNQEVKFTKQIYDKLAIQALDMSDEEYENGKLD